MTFHLFLAFCLIVARTHLSVNALASSLAVPPPFQHDLLGSFRLTMGPESSVPIAPFASPSELASALTAIPSIESPVTIESSHTEDYMEWQITFPDSFDNDFNLDVDLANLASTNPDDSLSYSVTTEQSGSLSDSYGSAYLYSDATTCGSFHNVGPDDDESQSSTTIRDETRCSGGIPRTFAIIAEAESTLGGSFDIFYEGTVATIDLDLSGATVESMEAIIRSLSPTLDTATVEERSYQGRSTYGKVWIVRHPAMAESTEELVIGDKWTTGSKARVDIYPVLSIRTSADDSDIVGDYRIHLAEETTAPIAMGATANEVVAELHQLVGIGKVVSVSPSTAAPTPVPSGPVDYNFAVMAHTADLDSFFVTPESNWGGTEARIFAIGPNGQVPMQYVVPTDAGDGIHSIRISAHNDQGYSVPSTVATVMPGIMLPGTPQGVRLGEFYGANELSLSYQAPAHDGGSTISKYKVEWSTSITFDNVSFDEITAQPEQQEIVLSCRTKCHGTFTLSWGGKTTDPIATDATAPEVEAQIAALIASSDGSTDTSVRVIRRGQGFGYRWMATFYNAPGNLNELVADGHWLYGGNAHVHVEKVGDSGGGGSADIYPGAFTNEVQTVYISKLPGFTSPATGTFRLMFEDKTTDVIDVSASTDDVKAALEALGTIHTVNVESQDFNGQPGWAITFTHLMDEGGKGAGDIDLLRVVDAQLSEPTVTSIEVFENVKGTEPLQYTIDGLTEGQMYYARVFAQNQVGWSKPSFVSSAAPKSQPGIPAMVNVSTPSDSYGTSLDVSWLPPPTLVDGGDSGSDNELLGYEIEYYSTPPVREVQKITTSSTRGVVDIQTIRSAADSDSISGFFTLSFKGERTEPIAHNALADGKNSIESKLKRLSTIGNVEVTRDISTRPVQNEVFVLTTGSSNVGRGASSTADLTSLFAAGDMVVVGGEQHTVATVNPTSFALNEAYAGPSSSEAYVSKWAHGYEWQIVFESHIGEQPLLQVEPAENWAGNNPTLTVHHTRRGLAPMSGTFQLSFGGEKTKPLEWNADENQIKAALESLHDIGTAEVTRYSNAQGFNWFVTFIDVSDDSSSGRDIPLMGINDRMLNGPNAKARVASIVDGVQGNDYGRIEVAASEQSLTLKDLSKGTPLFISVRAKNTEGYGASRLASPSPIAPKTAPNAPLNAEVMPLSATKILVRWKDPDDNGGSEIKKYRIEWDILDTYNNASSPGFHAFVSSDNNGDGGKNEYIISIDEDSASMPRYVRVSCYNGYGWSSLVEASGSPVRAALQLPTKPEFEATVTSGTGAMLAWARATWDTVGSYLIEVYEE